MKSADTGAEGPKIHVRKWFSDHVSSVVLCVSGVSFVAAAVWVVPNQGVVGAELVLFGAAALILGALLPSVSGEVSIGKDGIKFVLQAVRREAEKQGLSSEAIAEAEGRAIERLMKELSGWRSVTFERPSHRVDALIAAPTAEALASAVVAEVKAQATVPPAN